MEVVTTGQMVWRVHGLPTNRIENDLQALEENALTHLKAARTSAQKAYAPYSNFRVGASVEAVNDEQTKQFTGCNVENASYGATICAERVAMLTAVAAEFKKFNILALSTLDTANEEDLSLRAPCGLCRQVMAEFFDEATIILIDGGSDDQGINQVDFTTLDLVLPWRFQL